MSESSAPMSCLLLFNSTHAVIRTERMLLGAGIPCKVIPVPKNISSDCGIAILVSEDRADDVRRILETHHVTAQWSVHKE